MRRSSGTPALRSTMPFCTSIAQRTASTTLRNSMRLPSPVRLTTRPRCAAIAGINQIAAQRPEPRERSLLVGAGEPAVADDIGDQDRSDLPRFRHGAASGFGDAIMNDASALLHGASRGANSRR